MSSEIAVVVEEVLRSASLRPPRPGEGEEPYSRTVLLPAIRGAVSRKRWHGTYVVQGEGDRNRRACVAGPWSLYPDATVVEARTGAPGIPLVAVEVKFLNSGQSLATAIGQAFLYRSLGDYERVFLLGVCRDVSVLDSLEGDMRALTMLHSWGISVVLMVRGGD